MYYALLSRLKETVVKPRARRERQSTRVLSPSDFRKRQGTEKKSLADVFTHRLPCAAKKEKKNHKNLPRHKPANSKLPSAKAASAATADLAIRFGNQPQATSPTKPKPPRERPQRDVPRHKPHLVPTVAMCGEAAAGRQCTLTTAQGILSTQVASHPTS